jgi:hypothetical protein
MAKAKPAIDPELDEELISGTVPEGAEGEEDLSQLDLDKIAQAVVYTTDWTAETVLSQVKQGNINIDPKFQRRDVWKAPRKSKFIESLILGLPVPQLVFAEDKTRGGAFIVIDGKQRLLTLRQFAATADDEFTPLKLGQLTYRPDLQGFNLEQLEESVSHQKDFRAFQNRTIRTVIVKNWPNERYLYLVFYRLNTGSVPLSPQELRQALHPGPFVDFADDFSTESKALQEALNLTRPDFRMRDVELVTRYFAFRFFLSRYTGNLKAFLDTTCADLNSRWATDEKSIHDSGRQLESALIATQKIFGANAFRKWQSNAYEPRFNRAVFDVMTYFLSNKRIREAAVKNRGKVENSFRKLCATNTRFKGYLETTTKSLEATAGRLNLWGNLLGRTLRIKIAVPILKKGRINA